ncbi:protein of unknown function [Pseudomonas sp. JV551A1]|uniref:Uncharacterized protein n=1 Tax=Pseudomonas inefficax TaxID=2078786 RepID=A0AAQ1P4R4_9PSED|nr:protein of unknown function [Pseudomonas sp. JV551A1]SPO59871.1 protein of unknown function [Pseudomonas inefficax]
MPGSGHPQADGQGMKMGKKLGVFAMRGVAPVRSSAARAALRSTRLLLHLFRANYS